MDDAHGCLTATQLAWLEQVLATAPGPTAIFMHVPPAGVTSQWDWACNIAGVYYRTDFDDGAAQFRELCRAYGVTVVYTGHIHAFDAAYDDNGTLYIVTGGGGGETYEFQAAAPGNFFHITVAEVNADGIQAHTVYVSDYQYYYDQSAGQWQVGNLGVGRSFTLDVSKWESNIGQ